MKSFQKPTETGSNYLFFILIKIKFTKENRSPKPNKMRKLGFEIWN